MAGFWPCGAGLGTLKLPDRKSLGHLWAWRIKVGAGTQGFMSELEQAET